MSDLERRYTFIPVQMRARGDKRTIGGYAAMFGKFSRDLGGFVEVIDATAFNRSMGRGWPDVMARYNHDDNMLLGTTGSGALRLEVDKTGLLYDVDPPKARQDIIELVERGDVRQSSFAFRLIEDDWGTSEEFNYPQRTLVAVDLVDVAPVNVPAYPDTTAALRSLATQVEADLEEVRSLAKAGELNKFFKRSDGPTPPKPRTFGPAALMELKAKEDSAA